MVRICSRIFFRVVKFISPTKGGKSYVVLCFSGSSSIGLVVSRLGLPKQRTTGQVAYTAVTYALHSSECWEAKVEVLLDAFSLE